jgi:hypothetical protein
MRQRHDRTGIYILAAAMFDPGDADDVRAVMRSLVRGGRRFHWRNEEVNDRRKAVRMVGDLQCLYLIVVGTGLDNHRQERGRRQCLERLLWELADAGVTHVWLDARRPAQNRRDLQLVSWMGARRILGGDLRVDFAYAAHEPLTWLPDILAGAVGAALGGDRDYMTALASVVAEMITIELC